MKKMKFMLFAVAAIAAASCAKEESQGNTSKTDLVSMSFEAGAENTRVQLQEDNSFWWEETDQIKIYDGISTELPAFTSSGNAQLVTFNGNVSVGATEFYAVYPHSAAKGFDSNTKTLSITLPETQTASAGNVPSNAFISVAKADDANKLFFKNVTAFVKFSLADATDVKEVTISGNAGEVLTGDITVTIGENGIPTNVAGGNVYYTATLKGEDFESEKDYYIAIRSANFAKGITMSVYRNNGTSSSRVYFSSGRAPEENISRNMVFDLGQIDLTTFKTTAPSDQFLAYLHGFNVTIGDIKLHKNSGIAPKLVTAIGEKQELKNEFHQKSGDVLLFLDQNDNCSFIIGSVSENHGNIRLIGRKNSKTTIYAKGSIKAISGSLYLKNINFITNDNTSAFIYSDGNTTTGLTQLYVTDCNIKALNNCLFNNNSANADVSDIYFYNNDIEVAKNVNMFANLKNLNNFRFSQNVVYNTDFTKVVEISICNNGQNSSVNTIEIKNNTIANLQPVWSGYIYIDSSVSTTITNNLFYLPNLNANRVIFRPKTYPTDGQVSGNFCLEENKDCALNPLQTTDAMTNEKNYSKNEDGILHADSNPSIGYYKPGKTYGATR